MNIKKKITTACLLAGALAAAASSTAFAANISSKKAESAALIHAGISQEQIIYIKSELDQDDDDNKYEVEFLTKDFTEYDYEIDAASGVVIKFERDADDDMFADDDVKQGAEKAKISKATAKKIALKRAGVKQGQITDYEIELDEDDGKKVYEGSFNVGRTEYDFEISASDGSIIKWETEVDD